MTERESEPDETDDNPGQRLEQRALWVDGQIRRAMERGEFDNLPGHGKPIKGFDGPYDPNWWVKGLIEREQLSGIGPAGPRLRKEDAELDARLDKETAESSVRQILIDFNERVIAERRQLMGGPPVTTAPRDVDKEVEAWRTRRMDRIEAARVSRAKDPPSPEPKTRRSWWRRG